MARIGALIGHFRQLIRGQGIASTDGELLSRFVQHRDQEAFAGLVNRYGGMVLAICQRVLRSPQDAEDAFQAAFLILARKAATLEGTGTLAGWLHAVALNAARDARRRARRLQERERQVDNMPEPIHAPESADGIKELLDEELGKLPARYRTPLVLCCLLDRTQEEAAHELGYSRDTVRRRVEQGRELLRQRLVRHGLVLSSSLFATALMQQASPAAVPAALASTTVNLACQATAACVPSPSVASLLDQGVRHMYFAKVKALVAVAVALLVLGGGAGIVTHQLLAGKGEPAAKGKAAGKDQAAAKEQAKPKAQTLAKGKTDPPGVPLDLKLKVPNPTITLGSPTALEWEVDMLNTGKEALGFRFMPDAISPVTLLLEGPGVTHRKAVGATINPLAQTAPRTLESGKVHSLKKSRILEYDETEAMPDRHSRGSIISKVLRQVSVSKPGDYVLTAKVRVFIKPGPKEINPVKWAHTEGYVPVLLTSNPIKIKVEGAKERNTDPAGVPLELKLVAKKATYSVDRPKSALDFEKLFAAGKVGAPEVDLQLEVHNKSDQPLRILLPWAGRHTLSVSGPAVLTMTPPVPTKADSSHAVIPEITIRPRASYSFPVRALQDSGTGGKRYFWNKAGEYEVQVTFFTGVSPAPGGASRAVKSGFGNVTVVSNTVKLKVLDDGPAEAKPAPAVPLELKLVAKKNTYTVSVAASQNMGQAVDLELLVENTGNQPLTFELGGGPPSIEPTFDLQGPGAVNRSIPAVFTAMLSRPAERILLAPGKSHAVAIKQLRTANANKKGMACYWTKPGDYTLSATLLTTVKGLGKTTLTSNAVKLKVK